MIILQPAHHHGFWDTLFGAKEEFVCYTTVHRNFYVVIFIIVVLAAIVAYSRFRIKNRSERELAAKNKVIEEQNQDILASIKYASRLQQALGHDENYLRQILPSSFIFLQPKDIVGGDFYFIEKHQDKQIIAAIDCTGHGVPGAFLTFIGYNAIQKAVDEISNPDPSLILHHMNDQVKRTLGQQRSNEEVKDGMEVGLCIYDSKSKVLEYAGAGTPLLLWKSGQLEEIKPTKCTVGSIENHITEAPQKHRFSVNAGDRIYMFSDGIQDQFGGEQGKKFMLKRLKEVLMSTMNLPIEQQKSAVTQQIQNWMKGHQQTDDMLLIGVEFN